MTSKAAAIRDAADPPARPGAEQGGRAPPSGRASRSAGPTGTSRPRSSTTSTGRTLVGGLERRGRPARARSETGGGGNIAGAEAVGKLVASRAKDAGITRLVFDRGGFAYHGRVAALADAVRAEGLEL